MSKLKVLDLFSGIGGFSLGLERTGGFETVAFCEIEPFPRRVLAKHWPEVPCYDDVRTLTVDTLRRDGIAVDVICGGFPCQDISLAGAGAGLEGERSGLWSEIARLVGELRPLFVIVENVAALLGRGLDRVLGDLAALGYDAEWHCIPASAVGAPHRRDRFWLVAYPARELLDGSRDAGPAGRYEYSNRSADVPDADSQRQQEQRRSVPAFAQYLELERCGGWSAEPDVGRMAHGVPSRVDRLAGLGNAVVPQIPELIGHAILASRRAAA